MGNWTVDGSGSYASLNAAIAVCTGNEAVNTANSWSADDTTAVTLDTDVVITVTSTAKNAVGKPGRSGGSHRLVNSSGHTFTVTCDDVDISDMDIMSDSTGVSDEIFRMSDTNTNRTFVCKRSHIGFSGNTDQQDIIYYDDDTQTISITFERCMFFDVGRSIIDFYNSNNTTGTLNFNGCSSVNIGANGGREAGAWVGWGTSSGNGTVTLNTFNNLIYWDDTNTEYAFAFASGDTVTVNADHDTFCDDATDDYKNVDTENTTGLRYSYTWTDAADPGTGDKIGLRDITTSPYDQRLTDHSNNDAIDVHSVETGANSGLTLGNDIINTAIGASEDHDIGAFEIVAAGETVTLTKGTLSFTGKDNFQNETFNAVKLALTLTGKDLTATESELVTLLKQDLTFSGKNLLQNETFQTTKGTLTLTGKDLFQNKTESLTKGSLSLTGKDLNAASGFIMLVGSLAVTGKDILMNETYTLVKAALSWTGKDLTILEGSVVQLVKGTLSWAGKTLYMNEAFNLVKGTLTLVGKAVTEAGTSVKRGLFRMGKNLTLK